MGKKKDKARDSKKALDKPLPHSTPGHLQSIDHAVTVALALPAELLRRPTTAVEELLRDARAVAAAATLHREALVDRGLTAAMADELVARADALSQAQAMWLADRRRGLKNDVTAVLLKDAETLRSTTRAVVGLALRKSRDGQIRLDAISGGEGIADLVDDLAKLSRLVKDADMALELINEDPVALASTLDKVRRKVEGSMLDDDAGRIVSGSKDLRDRLAVLVEDAIDEIRAFAAVAFHNDTTHERRGAFASLAPRRRSAA
jgi:hypothetical protein